jgi:hypothetical protein
MKRRTLPTIFNADGAIRPRTPEPSLICVHFLSWLKKRGATVSLRDCVVKWGKRFDIEETIKTLGPAIIILARTSGGEKVIRLMDKPWADQWMIYYRMEVPHHRQTKNLFTITGNRRKV